MKRTVALLIAGMGLAVVASSASALDNYTCYKSKDLKNPKFVATTRNVSDQFLSGAYDVKKPGMVCAPASIDGSVIADPATHLNCYKVKGPKGTGANAQLVDQFGTLQVAVKGKTSFLCVPASKTIIP
jgi:hypothetical protein